MIEEVEAIARIVSAVGRGNVEYLPLVPAAGRYAARDYLATVPLPGFDNSAMDGYAVRAADCIPLNSELTITGEQAAGHDLRLNVAQGECVRVFTGAPMPAGANAVVMQEDTGVYEKGGGRKIRILEPVEVGEFVRKAGGDVCVGQRVLGCSERIGVQSIGLLASQGLAEIEVHAVPTVGILSTGDELVPPDHVLEPGQIYNSNGPMLEALVRRVGVEVVKCLHAKDDPEALGAALGDMLGRCDFVLISGGVSVGDHDHVKRVLGDLGVGSDFWKVRVKPGKPFLFGRSGEGERAKFVFGLPGNPVSSFVTFLLFVRPAILNRMGACGSDLELPRQWATAGEDLKNKGDRPHYVRGSVDSEGRFWATGLQESHALGGLAKAEGMVRLDAEATVSKGSGIRVLRW